MRAPDSADDDGQPLVRLATDALKNDWLALTGIALMGTLPTAALQLLFAQLGAGSPGWTVLPGVIVAFGAHAAIAHRVAEMQCGRPAPVAKVLSATASRLLPLSVLAVVVLPSLALGFAFLVLPGLLISAFLMPVAPACVAEGRGPIEALRRSAALTAGSRGKLAKAAAGLGIVAFLFCLVVVLAVGILGGASGAPPLVTSWVARVASQVAALLVASALSGVAYAWLRGRQADEPRQF